MTCVACADDQVCQSGACACPAGQTTCNGACVNTLTNVNHCGACGHVCPAGSSCARGSCEVACGRNDSCLVEGQRPDCCDGECVDITSYSQHCGACGYDCQDHGGSKCVNAQCICGFSDRACPADEACCRTDGIGNAECRNLSSHRESCGACGHACDAGESCCNGACLSVSSDSRNCGACGHACGADQTCCNGVCTSVNSDNANCGRCGNACRSQRTCCSGSCRILATDIDHCGACDNVCPGDLDDTTSDVICVHGSCNMTCRAGVYDLNGDPDDGCEVGDAQDNHTQQRAQSLGQPQGCSTSDVRGVNGILYLDERVHNPLPNGWIPENSSAPLWWSVSAASLDSFGCEGYVVVNLRTEGALDGCVRLTVIAVMDYGPDQTASATVINNHVELKASILGNSNSNWAQEIYFKVEQVCGGAGMIPFRLEERLTERRD